MTHNDDNIVFIFPGQGSQYIGMGKSFLKNNKNYQEYFDIASSQVGENILDIINDNNDKGIYLENTRYSQAAIYALSCAVNDFLFAERGIKESSAIAAVGHSLGDYSALYACGAFNFEEGAKLVAFRSRIMAEEGDRPQGRMAMTAIIGCRVESIAKVLKKYKGRVFLANLNDYLQIVISGYADDVAKAGQDLKSCGAKRVIPLKVNIASHCPLMKVVSVKLEKYLNSDFNGFNDLKMNFFSSTEVKEIKKDFIKQMLVNQLLNPVRWIDSIEYIIGNFIKNIDTENIRRVSFIEVGPGKVLTGLVKRILSYNNLDIIDIFNTDSMDDIERIII
jgi:[acyl-carrier-protein] S-malonyltransferase